MKPKQAHQQQITFTRRKCLSLSRLTLEDKHSVKIMQKTSTKKLKDINT
jgi:hypothetical protein